MSGVTYTFSPNTKAKAAEVNQNFTDCYPTPWTTWSPTLRNDADGADIGGNVRIARYCQIGKTVFGQINADSIGDPGGNEIVFNLPVTPATNATYNQPIGGGYARNGTTAYTTGYLTIPSTKVKASAMFASAAVWDVGGGSLFQFNFTYEAA
jgi:hypothetical protein